MSEESTPASRQSLGVWIMSGSIALVMVIGGALAVNSRDKSVEEGNPTSTQTVAPGGGHILPGEDDLSDRSVTDATAAAGVLGAKLTDAGSAGLDSGTRQTVAPVLAGRDPARPLAQRAQVQIAGAGVVGSTATGVERQSGPAATDDSDRWIETLAPGDVEVFRSADGEELQVEFAVPGVPGAYAFIVSVDGRPYVVHVCVGHDSHVMVPAVDGRSTPYRFDPTNSRVTATLAPADFGYARPAFAADARVETTAVRPEGGTGQQLAGGRGTERSGITGSDETQRGERTEPGDAESAGVVERVDGAEPEQIGAIGAPSRPVPVWESSPEASAIAEVSTSLAFPEAEAESIEPKPVLPDGPGSQETPGSQESEAQFTSAETGAPQPGRVEPEATVTYAQPREHQGEENESSNNATQSSATPLKRPKSSVQTRRTTAEPRPTATASDSAGNGTLIGTPAP